MKCNAPIPWAQTSGPTRKTNHHKDVEVIYHYGLEEPSEYGSENNRLMFYETFDTTGGAHDLISTTYYYYNEVGNVARVVEHPAGTEDYTAARMVYALNGNTVTYVMGETWQWNGQGDCPNEGTYAITYAREFRYDGAQQRYLNRELDTVALLSEQLVSLSETWSDYAASPGGAGNGDWIYGDFTVNGGTVTNVRSFEPGIARSGVPGDPLATEYYHADHLGTTRLLSDNGSAGILPAVFTAFGERVAGPMSGGLHRYGYAGAWGYQAHGDFPYLHVGHRYYDPGSGRFLQRDPVGMLGGSNVYEYVRSTPSVTSDPDGLWNDPAGPLAGCGLGGPCRPRPPNTTPLTPDEELKRIKIGRTITKGVGGAGVVIGGVTFWPVAVGCGLALVINEVIERIWETLDPI